MGALNRDRMTAVQVAEWLGVTDRSVRKWIADNNLPCNPGDGVKTLAWPAVLAWYVDFKRKENGTGGTAVKIQPQTVAPGSSESYEDALARKTRAEANLKELQLAKERGQVASLADVEKVLASSVKATQTQVLAVPSRLATRMLGLEDHGRAVAILEAEMRQLLSNLATIDAVRESSGMTSEDEGE